MEAVEVAAPELEVSCVTGLPARTARPFVPFFLLARLAQPRPIFLSHVESLRTYQYPDLPAITIQERTMKT
jgi:hypothetical protein